MRWNGVFILGLGVTAIGFMAITFVKFAGFSPDSAPKAMAIAISVLAIGALTACLGSIMGRKELGRPYRRPRRDRLFTGGPSRTGTNTRNFGQRAEYSELGRRAAQKSPTQPMPPSSLSLPYYGPR